MEQDSQYVWGSITHPSDIRGKVEFTDPDPVTGKFTKFHTNAKSGVAIYDKGIDAYILVDTSLSGPVRFNCTYYAQARGLVSHSRKVIYWIVSRSGCCTALGTILSAELGKEIPLNATKQPACVWRQLPRTELSQIILDKAEYIRRQEEFADYQHVTVYQDQLARFINLCNYWSGANISSLYQLTLRQHHELLSDKQRAIWHIIAMAKANMYNMPGLWEQHLASQMRHYDEIPRIDLIVPLPLLDDYFIKELKMNPVQSNREVDWRITIADFTDEMSDEVVKLYSLDFTIPLRYGDRFFKA